MAHVEIGTGVPSFSVETTAGALTDKDLAGHNTVLYFYPRDNTPGCTLEGQEFRDLHDKFKKADTEIYGISRDSLKSHEKFCEKQNFPFDLISDPDEKLCNLFGVIKDKNMYGKKVRGIERSTFLIDGKGVVRQEWRKVKPKGHAAEVLEAITQLK
ncbi:MAG TPA: peroxiredoxin [Gammaproteobacteria bacterium]|nr:peroxiredoxin [Gammaproteobacteria bacterium]